MVVLLSGGVGGSKLAVGMSALLSPTELTIVANTADDVEMYGVYVSPDFDILVYTLAGEVDRTHGWGLENDSFHVMEQLQRLGVDCWFKVGDRDLACCLYRAIQLKAGRTPSEVACDIRRSMSLDATVVPMTDGRVMTHVRTDRGWLHFQEYLVREAARPTIYEICFRGIETAAPSPDFLKALQVATAVVIAPSNTLVSIAPILAIPGVSELMRSVKAVKVAVSPLIGGAALKGPLAKMMRDLGYKANVYEVAKRYAGLVDVFLVDHADRQFAPAIERDLGMRVVTADIRMTAYEDKVRLAQTILDSVRDYKSQG